MSASATFGIFSSMAMLCRMCASAANVVSKFPMTVEPVAVTLSAGTQPLLSINECCANRKAASIPSSGYWSCRAHMRAEISSKAFSMSCFAWMASCLFIFVVFSYGLVIR